MLIQKKLENEYTLGDPKPGQTITLNLQLGDKYANTTPTVYTITDDKTKGLIEKFTIYPDGLAIFSRQTASRITEYTNGNFELDDDGNFKLVSFEK